MKKYKIDEVIEAWGIFMGLCEEFPELYDKYVEKIEKELVDYKPEIKVIDAEKKLIMERICQRIENDSWK